MVQGAGLLTSGGDYFSLPQKCYEKSYSELSKNEPEN